MEEIKGTKIFNPNQLKQAAKLLKNNQVVAFPTETVYGLGANAYSKKAVEKIFAAKKRPADNPLIIHLAEKKDVKQIIKGDLDKQAKKLMAEFWPGPLTLILPKNDKIPQIATGGLDTIAVRIPDHSLARQLISLTSLPIAAPSANLSGRPSPTMAKHVIDDLAGRIAGIIKGEQSLIGLESTVLDLSKETPVLLRPGAITYEQLVDVLGVVKVDENIGLKVGKTVKKALAPGMKYRHYSPLAEVVLVEGDKNKIAAIINQLIKDSSIDNIGVMSTKENKNLYKNAEVKVMGSRKDLITIGNNIFKLLREFDEIGVDLIYIEGLNRKGIGLAIMNRLKKAAGNQVIEA